jgi:hypothetical protein
VNGISTKREDSTKEATTSSKSISFKKLRLMMFPLQFT